MVRRVNWSDLTAENFLEYERDYFFPVNLPGITLAGPGLFGTTVDIVERTPAVELGLVHELGGEAEIQYEVIPGLGFKCFYTLHYPGNYMLNIRINDVPIPAILVQAEDNENYVQDMQITINHLLNHIKSSSIHNSFWKREFLREINQDDDIEVLENLYGAEYARAYARVNRQARFAVLSMETSIRMLRRLPFVERRRRRPQRRHRNRSTSSSSSSSSSSSQSPPQSRTAPYGCLISSRPKYVSLLHMTPTRTYNSMADPVTSNICSRSSLAPNRSEIPENSMDENMDVTNSYSRKRKADPVNSDICSRPSSSRNSTRSPIPENPKDENKNMTNSDSRKRKADPGTSNICSRSSSSRNSRRSPIPENPKDENKNVTNSNSFKRKADPVNSDICSRPSSSRNSTRSPIPENPKDENRNVTNSDSRKRKADPGTSNICSRSSIATNRYAAPKHSMDENKNVTNSNSRKRKKSDEVTYDDSPSTKKLRLQPCSSDLSPVSAICSVPCAIPVNDGETGPAPVQQRRRKRKSSVELLDSISSPAKSQSRGGSTRYSMRDIPRRSYRY